MCLKAINTNKPANSYGRRAFDLIKNLGTRTRESPAKPDALGGKTETELAKASQSSSEKLREDNNLQQSNLIMPIEIKNASRELLEKRVLE